MAGIFFFFSLFSLSWYLLFQSQNRDSLLHWTWFRRHSRGGSEEGEAGRDRATTDISGQRGLRFRKCMMTWKSWTSCPDHLNLLSWRCFVEGRGGAGEVWYSREYSGPQILPHLCCGGPTGRNWSFLGHYGPPLASIRKQKIKRKHLEWVLPHSEDKWQQRRK